MPWLYIASYGLILLVLHHVCGYQELKRLFTKIMKRMIHSRSVKARLAIVIFIINLLIVSFLPTLPVRAANDDYVNVNRDGWTFYVDGDTVIATNGTRYAFYKKENTKEVAERYKQQIDYYKQPGESFKCGSHIDIRNGAAGIRLYEEGNGGQDCGKTNDYTIGDIKFEDATPDIKKVAAAFNYGNKPLGCPGFGDIPRNANKRDLDYNCPEGGAVINGEYKKNKTINTPNIQQADAGADCNDVGGAFNWIICGLGSLAAEATKLIDGWIYSLLSIPVSSWESSGVKAIWESMRTISSILIVLVSLVAIASQIFNFDFISAYTIRKVLPKLFIAVILIQLSWFLGTMAVTISNTVGYSIQALITAPVEAVVNAEIAGNGTLNTAGDGWIGFADVLAIYAESANQDQLSGAGVTGIFAIGMAAAAGSAYAAGPAVILIIASALITGTVAMIVAFAVIALRYVLILALVVIMPLALVAWILPSTSKWFDKWWSMFFALLAMFPIVIAVLTFGKVAAVMIALSAAGG